MTWGFVKYKLTLRYAGDKSPHQPSFFGKALHNYKEAV